MTDKDEFCECIHQCEKAMFSLAVSIVKNESDAGEVISESIYRAYKNSDSLKSKKAFKPWILRIVHNTAVEMIRKNTKYMFVDQINDDAGDETENKITTKLTVREAVNELKQPYRTVVVLFYYENLSISKIAQITSTNIVSVKKQLQRARQMLRKVLEEAFNE